MYKHWKRNRKANNRKAIRLKNFNVQEFIKSRYKGVDSGIQAGSMTCIVQMARDDKAGRKGAFGRKLVKEDGGMAKSPFRRAWDKVFGGLAVPTTLER